MSLERNFVAGLLFNPSDIKNIEVNTNWFFLKAAPEEQIVKSK